MVVGEAPFMGNVPTSLSLEKISMPDAVATNTRPSAEVMPLGCADSLAASPRNVLFDVSAIRRVSSQAALYARSGVVVNAVTWFVCDDPSTADPRPEAPSQEQTLPSKLPVQNVWFLPSELEPIAVILLLCP